MSKTILVTYASRTGTTASVAEAIGNTLIECGVRAVVWPMAQVSDVSSYHAVVAGSAIRYEQWLPEAMEWLRMHRYALAQRPFAAYLVCMTQAIPKDDWRKEAGIPNWLKGVRALVKPVSEGYFAGSLDIDRVASPADRLKFQLSVWSGVWSEGDHRDWDAIRAWTLELPAKLELQASSSA